jgi:hypothetical protein
MNSAPPPPAPPAKLQRVLRRILELVVGLAFLAAILYWPGTRAGQILLIAAVGIAIIGLFVLRKWQ